VDRDLQTNRELEVVARDDRGRREAADDLVRDVRPGEDGDRPAETSVDSRAPSRVEALREAEDRRVAGRAATTSPKTRLGTATTTSSRRRWGRRRSSRRRSREVGVLRVRGLRPVAAIASTCRRRARRASPSWPLSRSRHANAVPHEPAPTTTALTRDVTKSMETGTPSSRSARELVLDPVAVVARHEPCRSSRRSRNEAGR
jgi:hypothetical protein